MEMMLVRRLWGFGLILLASIVAGCSPPELIQGVNDRTSSAEEVTAAQENGEPSIPSENPAPRQQVPSSTGSNSGAGTQDPTPTGGSGSGNSYTLHTDGNRLVNAAGKEVRLRGVNIASFEWTPTGEHVLQSIDVAFADWKVNSIRLPIGYKYWLGSNGVDTATFQDRIDAVIKEIAGYGGYVILDNHSYKLPDGDQYTFWTQVAKKYANHPNLLF